MSANKIVQSVSANTVNTTSLNVSGNFVLKGVTIVTPLSGHKIKVGAIGTGVIIAPTTSLDEVTVLFPQNSVDGQIMFISFTQDVKNVIFANAVFANASLMKTAKAGDSITLFFNQESNKWYKLGGSRS